MVWELLWNQLRASIFSNKVPKALSPQQKSSIFSLEKKLVKRHQLHEIHNNVQTLSIMSTSMRMSQAMRKLRSQCQIGFHLSKFDGSKKQRFLRLSSQSWNHDGIVCHLKVILYDSAVQCESFSVDRIVGIRSFHEFNASGTNSIACRSVSSSTNSKSFYFKFDRTLQTPIKRIFDRVDFTPGAFLVIERDEIIYLSQITTTDHQKHSLNVSLLSPPLPCMTFSTSKSPSITIRLSDVLGCLVDPPTMTRMKKFVLTEEQFVSIQDICDEFWALSSPDHHSV